MSRAPVDHRTEFMFSTLQVSVKYKYVSLVSGGSIAPIAAAAVFQWN